MKKISKLLLLPLITLFASCEDFLEQVPKDQMVIETTFTSYSNFKTYAAGFYETFPGYADRDMGMDWSSDMMLLSYYGYMDDWIEGIITVPTESSDYTNPYARIRRINIMLDNVDNAAKLSELEKAHWKSVGYFFRAYEYFQLVKKYGDVFWVDHTLTDSSQELFQPRTPRNTVASNILADLQYAEEHIKVDGDGPNTINRSVVRALISRFGLFEGTWRKYHGLGDEAKYLNACKNAASSLMKEFTQLMPNYDLIFNSESLKGAPGILLYKQYETGELTHSITSRERNSAGNWDLTKKAADMYLMQDGKTRWETPAFNDKDPYDEFRNRDLRMLYTITPPFKVSVYNTTEWNYDPNPKYREYIDLMSTISDAQHKALPSRNWAGVVLKETPHFRYSNNGQGFNVSCTGYKLFKYYNDLLRVQNVDISDFPIFRMGEVLLDYAEVMYELGEFNQTVTDLTINKLRARGKVAPLVVGSEPNDPTRDATVDPTLWEIRRERAIELMGEGRRFDDLRRWKKMNYTDVEKLGRWVNNADYGNKLKIQNNAAQGYVVIHGTPPNIWPDYYYLYPIPSNEIVLTDGVIEQNPGW